MIYFITKFKDTYHSLINTNIFNDVVILNNEEGLALYNKTLKGKREVYLDIEASGLDAYQANILLVGVKVKSSYFMFDYTTDMAEVVKPLTKKYVVGHNLKYDIKLLKVISGILIKRLYDTMIAEQRLFMGAGYEFGYDKLVERYVKEALLKTTRNEFINAIPETFKITYNHLNYLRNDLKHLPTIKKAQQEKIKKWKQEFLIYGIENAFVPVVASAELEGFVLNEDKWITRIKKEQEKKYQILCKLDNIVRTLRDTLPNVQKDRLVGGKWSKTRLRNNVVDIINTDGTTEVLDLFGEPASAISLFSKRKPSKSAKPVTKTIPKIEEYPGCISYTKQEVIHIFASLNQMCITELEQFSIPKFDDKGKLPFNKYTITASLLERYLILRPNTVMREFLETFAELQKVNKSLSTYGKSFLSKVNPITGKVHTQFGQCFTNTGRMSSGGGKKEPDKYNSQNLPRDKELRNAFGTDKGYVINTADYSGAELIVMASHAQDFKLLELSKGDMHSHFATLGWREIYRIRAANALPFINSTHGEERAKYLEDYKNNLLKSQTYTVTKADKERQDYKPVAFGVVYDAHAKKIGQVLNISTIEGQGAINTVKKEIPKTIAMVEAKSAFAKRYGYVIHNERTNSRRWFPALIKRLKGEYNDQDNFKEISKAMSEARNTTIQGTQADFVKEASVKLQYFYWKKGYDAVILKWVHDEIVDKMREEDAEKLSLIKHEILVSVANKYLNNVTIDAEYTVLPYWTK